MRAVGGEAFDGDDPVGRLHVADADRAGALHLVIDVHGAGAALRDAASIFRAGEADLLADDPKERGSASTATSRTLPLMLSFAMSFLSRIALREFCCRCFAGAGRELEKFEHAR